MMSLFKDYYGRGPMAAKAITQDAYAIIVLEDGLTRNERTLVDRGRQEDVRSFRLAFQDSVREQAIEAVTQATGRRVIGYHSQIIFEPVGSFELFVLEP